MQFIRPLTTSFDHSLLHNLEQASRALMHEPSSAQQNAEVKELMQQWHATLFTVSNVELLEQAVERMTDLYQLLLQQQPKTSNLDSSTFRCMLQACSRFQPNGPQALAILEAWNQVWIGDMERSPTREDYHSVLEAYTVANQEDVDVLEGSQVALEVLQRLDQWGFTMRPNLLSHSLAVCCVSNVFFQLDHSQDLRSLHQEFHNVLVKRLVDEMEQKETTIGLLLPTKDADTVYWATMAFGTVIRYYATVDGIDSAQQDDDSLTLSWVQRWIALSRDYCIQINKLPTTYVYQVQRTQRWKEHVDLTILAFFKYVEKTSTWTNPVGSSHLTAIFNDALGLVEDVSYKPLQTEHFYRAIKAAKRSHCVDEGILSDWVERMRSNHSRFATEETMQPSEQTKAWNCLMMAYNELEDYDEVRCLWQALNRTSHVRKDSISFAIVLKSLAKQGTFKAAEKAHAIWKKMVSVEPTRRYIHPTSQHYAHVMAAWSNSRDPRAHTFCQQVMDHLLEESTHDPDLQPGIAHYTSLIGSHGWSRRDPESRKHVFKAINDLVKSGLELDIQAYRACFAALARTQSTDGAMIAEQLLKQSIKQGLKPDARCFQAVLRAWAESQSAEALDNCEKLIRQLESFYGASGQQSEFRPNSHCYVSMIMAAMYALEKGGPIAESILDRMLSAAEKKLSDEPDKAVYSSVMKAYASDGSVEDVERIYRRMEEAFAKGNFRSAPDARSCAILMHAWAKSNDAEKAFRTRQLLVDMFDALESGNVDMMPTTQCYNAVLNSCAFSDSKSSEVNTEIVRIAIETTADMEKYHGEITEYAFRQIFHILGRCLTDKPDRLDLAATFFQKCCQVGCVSEHILRVIKTRIPEFYSKLPGDDISRLPSKWTRRVSQSHS